jgi:hypothetical protein
MRHPNRRVISHPLFFATAIQAFWRLEDEYRKGQAGAQRVLPMPILPGKRWYHLRPRGPAENRRNFATLAPLC